MSTIVFNRVRNHTQALEVDQEEELDAETYCTSIDSNVDSSNFLPIVHRHLRANKNTLFALRESLCLDTIGVVIADDEGNVVIGIFRHKMPRVLMGQKYLSPDESKMLLECVDNEELPPIVLRYLCARLRGGDTRKVFLCGCLLAEVHDYRQRDRLGEPCDESYFVLLRPGSASIHTDANHLALSLKAKYGIKCNPFWKATIESRMIHLCSGKICLDPRPSIGIRARQLLDTKLLFSRQKVLQLKRHRMKARDKLRTIVSSSSLYKFLSRTSSVQGQHAESRAEELKTIEELFSKTIANPLGNPHYPDLKKEDIMQTSLNMIHSLGSIEPDSDQHHMVKVKEISLENIDKECASTAKYGRIAIWRQSDATYWGHLYNSRWGEPLIFELGDEHCMKRYLKQFIEIFTDTGSKPMKIVTESKDEAEKSVEYTWSGRDYLKRHGLEAETPQQQQQDIDAVASSQSNTNNEDENSLAEGGNVGESCSNGLTQEAFAERKKVVALFSNSTKKATHVKGVQKLAEELPTTSTTESLRSPTSIDDGLQYLQ